MIIYINSRNELNVTLVYQLVEKINNFYKDFGCSYLEKSDEYNEIMLNIEKIKNFLQDKKDTPRFFESPSISKISKELMDKYSEEITTLNYYTHEESGITNVWKEIKFLYDTIKNYTDPFEYDEVELHEKISIGKIFSLCTLETRMNLPIITKLITESSEFSLYKTEAGELNSIVSGRAFNFNKTITEKINDYELITCDLKKTIKELTICKTYSNDDSVKTICGLGIDASSEMIRFVKQLIQELKDLAIIVKLDDLKKNVTHSLENQVYLDRIKDRDFIILKDIVETTYERQVPTSEEGNCVPVNLENKNDSSIYNHEFAKSFTASDYGEIIMTMKKNLKFV